MLLGGVNKIGNQVGPLGLLLDAGEDHLGSGNVGLRIKQILPQVLLRPDDATVLVGIAVRKVCRARLSAQKAEKIGALLGRPSFVQSVALGTLCFKDLRPNLGIARWDGYVGLWTRHFRIKIGQCTCDSVCCLQAKN